MNRSIVATALAYLALAACGVSLPGRTYEPNQADRALFESLDARWRAAGLGEPDAERCEELRPYLRIILATDDELVSLCSRCPPGNCPGYRASTECRFACGAECFTTPCAGSWPHCWGDGEFLGGHEHALIVVHESRVESDGSPSIALTRHGYLHFLASCTGLHRGSSDPSHADDRIWALDRGGSP